MTEKRPLTINAALAASIPDHDECYELDKDAYPTDRGLILCSDKENGFYLTDIKGNKKYVTLAALRADGIVTISIKLEYTLDTSKAAADALENPE